MFGRKKKNIDFDEDLFDEQDSSDLDEDGVVDDIEEDEDEVVTSDDRDEWDELDDSADWREDGPFDITEVDLADDLVTRIDFGSLILTPPQDMQLQLQVDQATGDVQSALLIKGNSGLEVAIFAAPRSGGLSREVRREMRDQALQSGGEATFVEGPFGTEIRRAIPMTAPDGQQAAHVSRTWLADGPRWLLRGVLMGELALSQDDAACQEFIEFFKNIVVRRGNNPVPQGELVTMTLPAELAATE
ncbi:MAG: DUF3710 domain-containing protein [Propionibacteriaceae bacterium]